MSGPADGFRPLGRGPAFPLANKLERVAFRTAWLLLARLTPPQLAPWRRFLLRLFGRSLSCLCHTSFSFLKTEIVSI